MEPAIHRRSSLVGRPQSSFSLITLNCFGVPAPTTRRRLATLAHTLNQHAADVVCLQEVQTHTYRHLLVDESTAYLSHAFEPFVHAPKGGLLTLARAPISATQFTLYRDRNNWHTPALMDWVLHKGVLLTQTNVADLPVVVLNTHLNANYAGDWTPTNRYARDEQAQLRQLAEVVVAQPREALVVVCGDFNVPRGNALFSEFIAASGLTDPLASDTRPTYRSRRGLPARFALAIDFALYRAPALPGLLVRSDLVFGERVALVGGGQAFLSDHIGVELQLTWDAIG